MQEEVIEKATTDLFNDATEKENVEKDVEKPNKVEETVEDAKDADPKLLQEELEKTRKAIADTKKYGHQNARKLKNALKLTQELVESGALSEEEAKSLFESLESDAEEDVAPSHPFGNMFKVANQELANMRKYSDDELLDDKVKAFDFFLSTAPQDEVKEALEELSDLSDDPIKLTKRMLAIGKQYYDGSYKDVITAGGIHGYITRKHEEVEKLNKTIDKLTKKLSQYEDFDKPRYRINEMGESDGISEDSITSLFNERDKVKRR